MVGIVERRVSKSALWCRRLAIFAMPFFLITILMHRFGNITSTQAMELLAVGFVLLVVSVLLAIRAMVQLWNDGLKGGKMMTGGLFLSTLMLTPFMIFAALAMQYPAINDVSTNVYSLPDFSEKTRRLRRSIGVPPENDITREYDEELISNIQDFYPKISPRRYPAGPERVLKAVRTLVTDRGWALTRLRGLPDEQNETAPVLDGKKNLPKKNADSKTNQKNVSKNEDNGLETIRVGSIYLDAVSSSPIFSFKNDVVIKIVEENENTLVEMRSAARWGIHDFGANARLIEKFLGDLDQNLIGIAGEG